MRINKYLAAAGLASRRGSDELVKAGKVKVNGVTVTELGLDIKPGDNVTVEGKKITVDNEFVYFLLNKPKGYISAVKDDKERDTVVDLIDERDKKGKRVFPVGRLDYDTEGILLITNDGDLTERLTHPRFEITKTYTARVNGIIEEEKLRQLRNGVIIDGKKTNKTRVRWLETEDGVSRYEVTISEGRNRQVRKMFETVGHEVLFLKRVKIGDLKLGSLDRGKYRKLTDAEIKYLKNL